MIKKKTMNIGGRAWDPLTSISRAILLIQHAPTIAHTSLELSKNHKYMILTSIFLILSNLLFLEVAKPKKTHKALSQMKHLLHPQT